LYVLKKERMSYAFPPKNRYRPPPFGFPWLGREQPPLPGFALPPIGRPNLYPSMTTLPSTSKPLSSPNLRNSHATLYGFERVKHLQRYTTVFVGNIHPDLQDDIMERLLVVRSGQKNRIKISFVLIRDSLFFFY
jgi:hypothetical protein